MRMSSSKCRTGGANGFTLIELLVSMALLMVIVLIVGRIFQEARTTWDVGTQKAELNMRGRAVVNYMAQELATAVGTNSISDFKVVFDALGDSDGTVRAFRQDVTYAAGSGRITRNGEPMVDNIKDAVPVFRLIKADAGGMPLGVEVKVTVTSEGDQDGKVFMSRAYFENRSREEADTPDAP